MVKQGITSAGRSMRYPTIAYQGLGPFVINEEPWNDDEPDALAAALESLEDEERGSTTSSYYTSPPPPTPEEQRQERERDLQAMALARKAKCRLLTAYRRLGDTEWLERRLATLKRQRSQRLLPPRVVRHHQATIDRQGLTPTRVAAA